MEQNSKKVEIGALWKKVAKSGESFISGTINLKALGFDQDVKIVGFSNKNKTNPNAPDIRLLLSSESGAPQAPAKPAATPARRPAPVASAESNDIL